ncbi:hypothetical protein FS842_006654, partial [Serendipita sp. 407]
MRGFISSSIKRAKWEIIRLNGSSELPQHQNSQARLPMELLMQIISYIEGPRHLQSLLLVSKIFRSIVEPVLYRVIKIDSFHLTPSKLRALYRTLEIPRIAELVTVLKVDLNKWRHCFQCSRQLSRGVIARSVSLYVAISAACSCDTLDREFGRVV